MNPIILPYNGLSPRLAEGAWIAPGAVVVGDVEIGASASIWFGCVVRGDVNKIRVGDRTNIQDGTILHVTERTPIDIGRAVTIGHGVILHGCRIGDGSLIGIGARVLDGATIGEGTLIGAGSLVTPGATIPSGVMAFGSPARVVRSLNDEERRELLESAENYVAYAAAYRARPGQEPFPPHCSR